MSQITKIICFTYCKSSTCITMISTGTIWGPKSLCGEDVIHYKYKPNVDACLCLVIHTRLVLSIMPLPLNRSSSHALQTILNTTNSPHNKRVQISGKVKKQTLLQVLSLNAGIPK